MSHLQGNSLSATGALAGGDSSRFPLSQPYLSGTEATGGARITGPSASVGLKAADQPLRMYDQPLTGRMSLFRGLEQLMNYSPSLSNVANASVDGRLQTYSKPASVTAPANPALITTPDLPTDPKIGLILQPLISAPCICTPDPLQNVPCPKTPCVRPASQGMQHKTEIFVPNDIVGCIIGRGGNKINEIRQMSQANIKISSGEDGMSERRVTITGTAVAIKTAQTMIHNSIKLHKHLIALTVAMSRLHVNPRKPPDCLLGRITNDLESRPLRCTPLQTRGNQTINPDGFMLTNYTEAYNTNSVVAPSETSMTFMGTRSAPAQIGAQGQSSSIPSLNTTTLGVSRKSSTAQMTPYASTPFLSAAQLENTKRGSISMLNPVETTVHQQKMAELMQQLPSAKKQEQLTCFGLCSTDIGSDDDDVSSSFA